MCTRNFARLSLVVCIYTIAVVFGQDTNVGYSSSVDQEPQNHGENSTPASEVSWIVDLAWNLLGYGTLVVPGAIIIRMIKNSNFNERSGMGQGYFFRAVQLCVFGTPEEPASVEEGPYKPSSTPSASEATSQTSFSKAAVKLLCCAAGLQLAYLTWGVLQERIMTRTYIEYLPNGVEQEVKFQNSQYLVFINRALALAVSGGYILWSRQPRHTAPMYRYSYSSFSNIMSSWCQYEALKFVSFPTQVLCKASKIIPVMIMGKIISKRTYQYYEYIVAVLLSVGVSLFLLAADPTKKHTEVETSMSGAVVLLSYMAFDSFTSNWQSELFSTYKMSSMQMMFGTNLFSSLFTLWSMVEGGNFFSSVVFTLTHPEFAFHATLLSFASATGQLFIFYTIQNFGPVIFTIIMTTRMMLSILLSCIIYVHPLSGQAIIGVVVVFVALFMRVYARYRTTSKAIKV